MLSFKELQEKKKSKIKLNPTKEEMMEKKSDHCKSGESGEDCDCMKCDKKRRKGDVNDGPDVATEGYDKPDEKLKTGRNMYTIPKDEQSAAAERLKAKAAAKRKQLKKEETETLLTFKQYVSEEGADSLKDRRMERGGVDGNNRYKKPVSNTPNTFGKKKPKYDGMSALEKVKAKIEKQYGKGAIMDTKKKK